MSKTNKEAAVKALMVLASFLGVTDLSAAEEGEGEEAVKVTVPSVKAIAKMKGSEKKKLATLLGIEADTEEDDRDTALNVLSAIANAGEDEIELDDAEVKTTLAALGLKASKKADENSDALTTYITELEVPAEESEETEETEEADEAEAEETEEAEEETEEVEEEEEAPKGKKKAKASKKDDDEDAEEEAEETEEADEEAETEESEGEELSDEAKAAIAKAVKATTPADQIKRLTAYNKAADEEIEFDKKKPAAGYAQLLEKMVDAEGNLAKWGKAYIKSVGEESGGYCCGLELKEVKVKVAKGEDPISRGECLVTGKQFDFDGTDAFEEVETE